MGSRGEVPCLGFGDEIPNVSPVREAQKEKRTAAEPKATIAVPTQLQKDLCNDRRGPFHCADDRILHVSVIYFIQ